MWMLCLKHLNGKVILDRRLTAGIFGATQIGRDCDVEIAPVSDEESELDDSSSGSGSAKPRRARTLFTLGRGCREGSIRMAAF